MATTGTSTAESPARQNVLFRASGTVSAKVKCSRSPAVSSVRLAVGEWHTNRRWRSCWVASSLTSNSTRNPADASPSFRASSILMP
jgi:arginyl-tRNA--protein-N-Asp/Glu arginylyltransferase